MQPRVGFRDPRELLALAVGEVVGVLPECVAGVLEPAGVTRGDPLAVAVAGGLSLAAGVVPCLAADLVERFGGPLNDVERVCATLSETCKRLSK